MRLILNRILSNGAPPDDIHRAARGQSLVEFALVLPMLLVLLLGIADFGRVFSAGIVLEASSRNAAEIAALERLRNPPTAAADLAYYSLVHQLAANTACDESRRLPTFDSTDSCPDGAHDSGGSPSWFVRVCVHDGSDPRCGQPVTGYSAAVPPQCSALTSGWSNGYVADASYYVEVRTCYKFETILNLDLALPFGAGISVGDVWLQRTRTFVLDCPVGDPATACPNPSP